MYNGKLAVAIKSNGKILREFKDTVYIPFGSEYSIFIKNLNSKRAIVKVTVDGQHADSDGSGFVIDGNSELDLERFVKNLTKGNRFKFIERTSNIENHRGIKVEDGLIRIEYQFEKEVHYSIPNTWPWYERRDPPPFNPGPYYKGPGWYPTWNVSSTDNTADDGHHVFSSKGIMRGMSASVGSAIPMNSTTPTSASASADAFVNDVGITVPGSESGQQFHTVSSFAVEDEKHVMVIKLLGKTNGSPVVKAVTTKHKPKCVTCGRTNKAHAKFCVSCGTALKIIA